MTEQQYHDIVYNQRVVLALVAAGLVLIAGLIVMGAALCVWMGKIGRESLNNLWLSRGLQTMTRDHTEKAAEKLDHVDQGVTEVKATVQQVAAVVSDGAASQSGTTLRTLPPEPSPGE